MCQYVKKGRELKKKFANFSSWMREWWAFVIDMELGIVNFGKNGLCQKEINNSKKKDLENRRGKRENDGGRGTHRRLQQGGRDFDDNWRSCNCWSYWGCDAADATPIAGGAQPAREELYAEERRLHKRELQIWDQDLRAEQRRREEENLRKDQEMSLQLDILRTLVEEIHDQDEANLSEHKARDKDVKLTNLMDNDDIEAYFTTFERQMTAYEVPRGHWDFKLGPQLSGRAEQAYSADGSSD
uniref:Uncharacterized protein n=1 Tax=Amphimedon queenslandica TaxID=400682 RepID=A0A1X7UXB5_AMPQE